jgi:hypothetical protein
LTNLTGLLQFSPIDLRLGAPSLFASKILNMSLISVASGGLVQKQQGIGARLFNTKLPLNGEDAGFRIFGL